MLGNMTLSDGQPSSILRCLAALLAARPPFAPDRWRSGAGALLPWGFLLLPVLRYLVVDCTPFLMAFSVRTHMLLAFFACPRDAADSDLSFSNACVERQLHYHEGPSFSIQAYLVHRQIVPNAVLPSIRARISCFIRVFLEP